LPGLSAVNGRQKVKPVDTDDRKVVGIIEEAGSTKCLNKQKPNWNRPKEKRRANFAQAISAQQTREKRKQRNRP